MVDLLIDDIVFTISQHFDDYRSIFNFLFTLQKVGFKLLDNSNIWRFYLSKKFPLCSTLVGDLNLRNIVKMCEKIKMDFIEPTISELAKEFIWQNSVYEVKILMDNGFVPNAKHITYATYKRSEGVINLFAQKNMLKESSKAFILASYRGYFDLSKKFLNCGVNPSGFQNSAFYHACARGRAGIAQMILKHPDTSINNKQKKYAYKLAKSFGKKNVMRVLDNDL